MSASLTPFGYSDHWDMRIKWQVAQMESSDPTLLFVPLTRARGLPHLHTFSRHAHTKCCSEAISGPVSGAVAPALLSFGAAAPLSWLAEHRSRGTGSGLRAAPSSGRGQGQDLNPTPALPGLVLLSPWWAASGYPQHSPGRE